MGSDYSFYGLNFLKRKYKMVVFSIYLDWWRDICIEDLNYVFKLYEKIILEGGE